MRIWRGQARRGQNVDNNICGYGGTGRRAGLRILWIPVQVQLLLSAPKEMGCLKSTPSLLVSCGLYGSCGTSAEFLKQRTPVVFLHEMSERISAARTVTEQGALPAPCERRTTEGCDGRRALPTTKQQTPAVFRAPRSSGNSCYPHHKKGDSLSCRPFCVMCQKI